MDESDEQMMTSGVVEESLDEAADSGSLPDVDMNGTESHKDETRAMLVHQIELEIALRRRIAQVVEARIRWAEKLKKSLIQGSEPGNEVSDLKQRSLDEFRSLHAPLNLDPHTIHPRGSFSLRLDTESSPPSTSASRQLYIIPPTSETTEFPPLLLLHCPCPTCPTPHPSTTLQGLLNHARITHGPRYTFASHDEFISFPGATTLLDVISRPDQYFRLQNEGVRVSLGGVRSLQTLFEGVFSEGGGASLGLGLSAETPALAGLLGRKTRKGEIRAFGQDDEVDVENVESADAKGCQWRKYGIWAPRRKVKTEMDVDDGPGLGDKDASSLVHTPDVDDSTRTHLEQAVSNRFHVRKRVVISDWSQSLRPSQVQPDGPTHRWMIRLSAPSYSDHITTFLSAVRVECASNPATFDDVITCSEPPFVVSRLGKVPFLARVTLVFADERTRDVSITQWVDLDPMRSGRPTLGAEQIFDVGLDRNALPLPPRLDNIPKSILWAEDRGVSDRFIGNETTGISLDEATPNATGSEAQTIPSPKERPVSEQSCEENNLAPLHERLIPIVSKLRSKLPLTLEDAKIGDFPTQYMCFPTRCDLLDAPHGRRKAVEWQYTRNILKLLISEHAMYDADLDPNLVKTLSVGRLYAYLAGEKVFPRMEFQEPTVKLEEEANFTSPTNITNPSWGPCRYCGICGLNVLSHPPTPYQVDPLGFACSNVKYPGRPMCDIGLWTTLRPTRSTIERVNPIYGLITTQGMRDSLRSTSQLVERASPPLVLAFHRLTTVWDLKAFHYSSKRHNSASTVAESRFPLELLGIDASHVDRALAPHALLALVAEIFIKRLVREGLRAHSETWRNFPTAVGPSVLTATHISRALMDGRSTEGWLPLMSVARVGIVRVDNT